MKKTPWFPAHVKPVREGVYEVLMQVIEDRLGGQAIEQGFCYFGKGGWSVIKSTPEEAKDRGLILGSQHKAWRGLAERGETK